MALIVHCCHTTPGDGPCQALSAGEKSEAGCWERDEGWQRIGVGGSILNRMVGKGLTEQVTFEQRSEQDEEEECSGRRTMLNTKVLRLVRTCLVFQMSVSCDLH